MGDALRPGVDWPAVRIRFLDRTNGKGTPCKAKGKGFREGNGSSWTRLSHTQLNFKFHAVFRAQS
eukprot:3959868-Pyramimonas_sp.AAC.1